MTAGVRSLAFAGFALVAALPGPVALAQQPATSPPSPGSGAITGTVVNGATGAAIAGAVVALSAQPGTTLPPDYQARQITDPRGRFAFLNLPAKGQFQIAAIKLGFLDGGYGRESAPTDPLRTISLTSSNWASGLRVTLWPPSSISGTVRDENGEPVVGVFVRVLARIRIAGRDELAAGPLTVTDDRGQYRISGLLPGRYIVQVPSTQMALPAGTRMAGAGTNVPEGVMDVDDTARLVIGRYPLPPPPSSGRAMTYAASFHPNVSSPAAALTVDLEFGDERTAIDVGLTPTPAVRVTGTVEGPPEALTSLTLRLLPAGMENLGIGSEAATALVAADGSFTFLNVPPGPYTLDAPITFNQFSMASGATMSGGTVGMRGSSLPPPPPRGGWGSSSFGIDGIPGVSLQASDFRGASGANVAKLTARMPVTVGAGDLTGVVVRLRPNAVLRGRVIIDGTPPTGTIPAMPIMLDPATGQPGLGQPRGLARPPAAIDFVIDGIQPAEYYLRTRADGWLMKSVEWRGRDYTNTPLDAASTDDISGVVVTVTNQVASLSGSVRASDGATPESAVVVIFPAQTPMRQNIGLWSPRFASMPVGSTGTYRFATLPAGDYYVVAIDRARAVGWRDPSALAVLERQATRISLNWGQVGAQDLTVIR